MAQISKDNLADGDLDMNGYDVILDTNGDSLIHSPSDDQVDLQVGGVNMLQLVEGATDYIAIGAQIRMGGKYLYLDADNDTYIESSSNNIFQCYVGGANFIQMKASGIIFNIDENDTDFTIAGDTIDEALFVEASSGNVCINTRTGLAELTIKGDIQFTNDGSWSIDIQDITGDGNDGRDLVVRAGGTTGSLVGDEGGSLYLRGGATGGLGQGGDIYIIGGVSGSGSDGSLHINVNDIDITMPTDTKILLNQDSQICNPF